MKTKMAEQKDLDMDLVYSIVRAAITAARRDQIKKVSTLREILITEFCDRAAVNAALVIWSVNSE